MTRDPAPAQLRIGQWHDAQKKRMAHYLQLRPDARARLAVGNAIYSAIGKRLRTTPFRKQDLSWT